MGGWSDIGRRGYDRDWGGNTVVVNGMGRRRCHGGDRLVAEEGEKERGWLRDMRVGVKMTFY